MIKEFEAKPILEHTVNEHVQFTLKVEDRYYRGLYNNGEISWFYPKPFSEKMDNSTLEDVESEVHWRLRQ